MTPPPPSTTSSRHLRRQLRLKRSQLSPHQQYRHQVQAIQQLKRSGLLRRFQRIAIYLDNDGELGTGQLIRQLQGMGKQLFLPVLYPLSTKRLWFLPYRQNTRLTQNRYRIAEPKLLKRHVPVNSINMIIMPLVGFDENGNRLGMGGGYYDRTLSARKLQAQRDLPLLLGYAHELQRVNHLDANNWDVAMDALITEKQFRKFTKA